jgi:hypothetical protein
MARIDPVRELRRSLGVRIHRDVSWEASGCAELRAGAPRRVFPAEAAATGTTSRSGWSGRAHAPEITSEPFVSKDD